MSRVLITFDPGSTHGGKLHFCKELIRVAAGAGADVIKWQLFHGETYTKAGNIELPREWFGELYHFAEEQGIFTTASVFDRDALELLFRYEVPFIKFGYSMQSSDMVEACTHVGKEVILSTDPIKIRKTLSHEKVKKLFVNTIAGVPTYPVPWNTNFEGLFKPDGLFDGFSDHSLGSGESLLAVQAGAQYLEKHITLPYYELDMPDRQFALEPKQAERYVKAIRDWESASV